MVILKQCVNSECMRMLSSLGQPFSMNKNILATVNSQLAASSKDHSPRSVSPDDLRLLTYQSLVRRAQGNQIPVDEARSRLPAHLSHKYIITRCSGPCGQNITQRYISNPCIIHANRTRSSSIVQACLRNLYLHLSPRFYWDGSPQ